MSWVAYEGEKHVLRYILWWAISDRFAKCLDTNHMDLAIEVSGYCHDSFILRTC
jgi:hypothetical protein